MVMYPRLVAGGSGRKRKMTADSLATGGDGGDGVALVPGRDPSTGVTLRASPARLRFGFVVAAAALVVVHLILQTVRFITDNHRLGGLLSSFSLGSDTSIPAYYSALAILFCAVLAFAIGASPTDAPDVKSWLGLSAIFVFLSVDEMLGFHEKLVEPMDDALDTSGLLLYAWVIPYGLAGLVFLAVYVPFLRRLPASTARRFVFAGAVFVFGALGMEIVGGEYFDRHGAENVTYVALQTVEEMLEMAGIIVFIHALAEYGVARFGSMSMALAPAAPPPGDRRP